MSLGAAAAPAIVSAAVSLISSLGDDGDVAGLVGSSIVKSTGEGARRGAARFFNDVANDVLTLHDGASLLWSIQPESWRSYEYSFGKIAVSNVAGEWFTFDLRSGPGQLTPTTPDGRQGLSIFTFSTSAGAVNLTPNDWHFWEGDICERPQGSSFSGGNDSERVSGYYWHSSYD